MDFDLAAKDYAEFRKGFPPSFFSHLQAQWLGVQGQQILDIGTGTGTLAGGFSKQGANVTALDISMVMLKEAKAAHKNVSFVHSKSEFLPFRSRQFNLVTAGQCWVWFDRLKAANECKRVLKPGGKIIIAHFDYLPRDKNIAELTEKLVVKHNPTWKMAGIHSRENVGRHDLNRPSVNLSQVAGVQPLVKKQVICPRKLQTVYIAT